MPERRAREPHERQRDERGEEGQHEDQVPRLRRRETAADARDGKNRKGVTSTQPTSAALARLRRTSSASPARAASSTTMRAGVQPTVKSRRRARGTSGSRTGCRASFRRRRRRRRSGRPARCRFSRTESRAAPTVANAGMRLARTPRVQHVETLRPSTSAPYGCVAMHARIASPQRIQPRRSRRSSALEQREVRQRRREQEDRVHAPVDAVEEEHPARHDDRRRDERDRPVGEARDEHAISGTLAIAKSAETRRNSTSPPPVCVITHAKRKWSGAPPRSPSTVRISSPNEPRLAKSASVSSSCGGQTVSRAKKNAAAIAVSPPTPARHSVSGEAASARERARSAVVVAALLTSGLSGTGQARC